MTIRPGSMYKVGGQRYVDSQALYNVAGTHEVVPLEDGWRAVVRGGSVRFTLVEGRPQLPGQRGALYSVRAQGPMNFKDVRTAWVSQGLMGGAATLASWPGGPEVKAGCGCGKTCGCAPCRLKHGSGHGHEHDHEHHEGGAP